MAASSSRADLERFAVLAAELARREGQRTFYRMFPDETTTWPDGTTFHTRALYPKHIEFFRAGATHRERCAMAANRVGKTFGMGGYELAAHLTGEYPAWWPGRRFAKPIRAWAAGKTNETTRDIVQATLLGEIMGSGANKRFSGTGVIPGRSLGRPTWKQGVQTSPIPSRSATPRVAGPPSASRATSRGAAASKARRSTPSGSTRSHRWTSTASA